MQSSFCHILFFDLQIFRQKFKKSVRDGAKLYFILTHSVEISISYFPQNKEIAYFFKIILKTWIAFYIQKNETRIQHNFSMKIQIVSDLHLELQANRDWIRANPILSRGDILLIAGDTICNKHKKKAAFFYKKIHKEFPFILSTMGNHEFYGSSIQDVYPKYEKWLSKNHLQLNNGICIHKQVKFIVSILWSFVPTDQVSIVQHGLNDYNYIYKSSNYEDRKIIQVSDTNLFHQMSLYFIEEELKKPFIGKTVLLTHHLPSYQVISPQYKDSLLNAAFASRLDDLIQENPHISLWVCGHSHERHITRIGHTIIALNPLGYVSHYEQDDFKRDFVLEI
jgi:predicted phosphodiesterase